MLEILQDPQSWIALLTLTLLEIVLGIDNIVFIAILTAKLSPKDQPLAYRLGLGGALVTRVLLLLALGWVMRLTDPLFVVLGEELSGRDLILIGGGLFLMAKATTEIYHKVEGDSDDSDESGKAVAGLWVTVAQIAVLDIVFSLDSVITAVGMAKEVEVMILAVVIAMVVMLVFAKRIGDFVNRHPAMKLLALSFLLMIGVLLTAEGFDQHINKGYIYFAMAFSLGIELLNMRLRKKQPHSTERAA